MNDKLEIRAAAMSPGRMIGPCLAAMVLAVASISCGNGSGEPAETAHTMPAQRKPDAISVATAAVRRGPMASLYSTSATLRAEKRATVTARTRGVLEQLLVEEGDAVTAGQVIAQLEDDEQKLALDRYTTIRQIKQQEFERSKSLHDENVISDSEFEIVRREAEEAKHDVELAALNLDRTSILAPFDGIVVVRHLDVGGTVSDGTEIYDLADIDPLYADVNVPERHVARLAADQVVRISADATKATVQATIERIAPLVDPATGTVKVTLTVERSTELRPGAFVQVDVVTDTHDDALIVPRQALVAEGRRWNLFRMAESGDTVQMIEVRIGFEEGELVEIAEVVTDGVRLDVDDRVVVAGASALTDGAAVRVLEERETISDRDSVAAKGE